MAGLAVAARSNQAAYRRAPQAAVMPCTTRLMATVRRTTSVMPPALGTASSTTTPAKTIEASPRGPNHPT